MSNLQSMRAHMAQHEEKKYTCNMCTQGFKFKLSLERHQAKCYPGKKPKVVTPKKRAFDKARVFCPCCNEGFTTLKLFRQHLDEVHRAEGIDIEEAFNSIKNIDCPQCHKKFATQVVSLFGLKFDKMVGFIGCLVIIVES